MNSPSNIPTQLAALLRQGPLIQAARLARAGQLEAAASLLHEAERPSKPDVTALDLLARIRVQQGACLEAERLWQRVLELEPANTAAIAAISRLHRGQRAILWRMPAIMALVAVVSLFSAFTVIYSVTTRSANQLQAIQEVLSREHTEISNLRDLASNIIAQNKGIQTNISHSTEVEANINSDLQALKQAIESIEKHSEEVATQSSDRNHKRRK